MKRLQIIQQAAVAMAIALFFLPGFSFAHTPEEEKRIAGTTPDSIFYGLDTALDKISLFFTFDDRAKAEKAIEIARERLFEIKVMIDNNKAVDAQKAGLEFKDSMETVSSSVVRLERRNSTQEIREIIEIEKKLDEHGIEAEDVKKEVRIVIEDRTDKAAIESIINSISLQRQEVEIEIENEIGKVKIKIKAETGKSDDEIENEIEEMRGKGKDRARVSAEIFGNATRVKVEARFLSNATDRNAIAQEILGKLKMSSSDISAVMKLEEQREFKAELAGSNENPPVQTNASGRAKFDFENDTMKFKVEVTNIKDAFASHIHLAPAGQAGPIVVTLYPGPQKNGTFSGTLAEGTATATDLAGPLAGQSLNGLANRMANGELYANVHTKAHPASEIRGQIMADVEEIRERLEAEARIDKGEIRAEFRFIVDATDRTGIIEKAAGRLSALTANDILNALEMKDSQGRNGNSGSNSGKGRGNGEVEEETPGAEGTSTPGEMPEDTSTPDDTPETEDTPGETPEQTSTPAGTATPAASPTATGTPM